MKKIMQNAVLLLLFLTLLTGVIYPLFIWGAGRILFRHQADGSLETRGGAVIGSSLIAQPFTSAKYFHPRPSAVSYNAQGSGGSNLSPSNPALAAGILAAVISLKKENNPPIPVDMVTQSGSGLDPHISPESALWQAKRVAKARAVDEKAVIDIINKSVEKPLLGLFGEKRVNVLALNMKLDETFNGGKK